ncbi:MAG: tetratricopeptide repeat protein [Flavobacteriales bacterium]|nr:tetratricopeptide repeat protein [Flavobacteriales bacterium]
MNLRRKNKAEKFLILLSFTLVIISCSTKKNNFVNRKYHGITAKYNGYFNGKESLKAGIKKLEDAHKDDFSDIIAVFKTGDLTKTKTTHPYMNKAIEKGSIVIQRHSMSIKGKEYNKWIDDNYFLIGKAYFYKGEFDEAIKTFNYIKETYKKNPIKYDAALWLARSYSEKEDYIAAEMELDQLQNDRKFPEKLEDELAVILADFYLKQDNYILALDELNTAVKLIKKRKKKTRYYFILAQLNQKHQNYKKATTLYQKVIKSNPEYEMVFNCKINKAQCVQGNNKHSAKVRAELLKMTKDDKNKEYLDQIYFAIAKMDLSIEDTTSAIENFKLSAEKSEYNETQKAHSFLELGKIFYAKSDYANSSVFYDSTIIFMDSDHKEYNQTKEKQLLLAELARYLNIINLEDSLQLLAGLSEEDLNQAISKIIKEEQKKELEKQQEERQRANSRFENNRFGGRENNFGQRTSGGRWYFYNSATLSFGHSEFQKKWGKRKLEDDWRRSDKKISNNLENDSTAQNQESNTDEKVNKKDPKYYKDKIPLTKEKMETSHFQIMEAHFQAGMIYKSYLSENKKAIKMLVALCQRYPKNENYTPLSYYNLYLIYKENNKNEKADECKETLLADFSDSKYSKLLNEKDYLANIENKQKKQKTHYNQTLSLYNNKDYAAVISRCDSLEMTKNNKELKPRYDLLKALATSKTNDSLSFRKQLSKIVKNYPETKVKIRAEEIIALLDNPEKMLKTNREVETGTPYIFDTNGLHYFLLLIPKEQTDVNFIKTLLSDYHNTNYSIESFEITAILFGKDRHLIMIKTFDNSKNATEYFNAFGSASKVNNELSKTESKKLIISAQNFQHFFKHKDEEKYYEFFTNNYLTEL